MRPTPASVGRSPRNKWSRVFSLPRALIRPVQEHPTRLQCTDDHGTRVQYLQGGTHGTNGDAGSLVRCVRAVPSIHHATPGFEIPN
jgi:hypothetical protein